MFTHMARSRLSLALAHLPAWVSHRKLEITFGRNRQGVTRASRTAAEKSDDPAVLAPAPTSLFFVCLFVFVLLITGSVQGPALSTRPSAPSGSSA